MTVGWSQKCKFVGGFILQKLFLYLWKSYYYATFKLIINYIDTFKCVLICILSFVSDMTVSSSQKCKFVGGFILQKLFLYLSKSYYYATFNLIINYIDTFKCSSC
jgi:hypothetical protein